MPPPIKYFFLVLAVSMPPCAVLVAVFAWKLVEFPF
jgi:hypothetical protein